MGSCGHHPQLAVRFAAKKDILRGRHRLEQRKKLERAADAPRGNVVVGKPGEVLVLQPDPARVWLPLAGDNIEQGRLAGAVWTDYRANLTFTNIEADAIDRQQAAEPLRQLLNPKHRLSHFALRSAASNLPVCSRPVSAPPMPRGANSATPSISNPNAKT